MPAATAEALIIIGGAIRMRDGDALLFLRAGRERRPREA